MDSIILIQKTEQFPDFEDKFWESIDSSQSKSALVFLILNKLRQIVPEAMTNDQLRSSVGELVAYRNMMDLKPVVEKYKKQAEEDASQDELEE
jgi:hypothetical protein